MQAESSCCVAEERGFGAGQGGWSCFPGKAGEEWDKPHVKGENRSDGAAGMRMRMEQQPGKAGTLLVNQEHAGGVWWSRDTPSNRGKFGHHKDKKDVNL